MRHYCQFVNTSASWIRSSSIECSTAKEERTRWTMLRVFCSYLASLFQPGRLNVTCKHEQRNTHNNADTHRNKWWYHYIWASTSLDSACWLRRHNRIEVTVLIRQISVCEMGGRNCYRPKTRARKFELTSSGLKHTELCQSHYCLACYTYNVNETTDASLVTSNLNCVYSINYGYHKQRVRLPKWNATVVRGHLQTR